MIWTFLIVCTGLMSAYGAIHPQQLTELREAGNYEEFARLLGIEDVDLVRPSKNDERSEVIDMRTRPVSPMGDILLTKEQREEREQARTHIIFKKYPSYKWKNCTICYWIDESGFTPEQVQTIKKAIDQFNKNSPFLKILPWSDDLGCENYVHIFSGQGCWSYLGCIGGAQALSLQSNGCVWLGTVVHELLHAAGFHHEQTRSDRDNYIEMLEKNIPEEWRSQYEMTDPAVFSTPDPYDYYSVMHYPVTAPGTDKPAFRVKQSGIDEDRIGKAQCLSYYDVLKLNNAYMHCDKDY